MTKQPNFNLNEFFLDGIEPGAYLPILQKFRLPASDSNALQKEERTGRHQIPAFFIDIDFDNEDELNCKRRIRIPGFDDWYKDLDPDWYDPDHDWYDPDHDWYDPDHGWNKPEPEPEPKPEPKPEPEPELPDITPFPDEDDYNEVWTFPDTHKRHGGGGGGG